MNRSQFIKTIGVATLPAGGSRLPLDAKVEGQRIRTELQETWQASEKITLKEPTSMYQIGLFGGMGDKKTLNNIKSAELSFGSDRVKVKSGATLAVGIKIDVLKLLNGPTNLDTAKNPLVMGGPFSKQIADNDAGMFSYDGFKKDVLPKGRPRRSVCANRNRP